MPEQVVTIKAVEKALSANRIGGYYLPGDGDVEAVARYMWNMALQAALTPVLHLAEITIRNVIFDASARVANTRGRPFAEIGCWLDTTPSLLYRNEQEAVEVAKHDLRQKARPMTPGHLVARLGFGFWVNLLNASYEQGRGSGPALWPAALKDFHNVPRAERTRAALRHRLDAVRSFRNRVAHHEPIWDRDPAADYSHVLETLGYFNPGMKRALVAFSTFPAVLQEGERAYLEPAEQVLGQKRNGLHRSEPMQ